MVVYYYELQEIVQDEVAYDFSVGVNQINVFNNRVKDLAPGPWSGNSIWNLEQWTIGQ